MLFIGVVRPAKQPDLPRLNDGLIRVGDAGSAIVSEGVASDEIGTRVFRRSYAVRQSGVVLGQHCYSFGLTWAAHLVGCGSAVVLTGTAEHASNPPRQLTPHSRSGWWELLVGDKVAFTVLFAGMPPQRLPFNAVGLLYVTFPCQPEPRHTSMLSLVADATTD
jgi:hypothetical protein